MNKKLLLKSFRNTTAAAIYIFGVSQIMNNGDKIFGEVDNMLAPFVFLLLFSLSAAVVGGLVLGESVMLFLDNKKRESITAAIYSVAFLALYTLLGIIVLIALK
jgi:hypothetical protein